MEQEEWRPVCDGLYEVSDLGNVRRAAAGRRTWPGRPLRAHPNKRGYLTVSVTIAGKNRTRYVHDLVAFAFLGPRPLGAEVNHRKAPKTNNAASNLEYLTHAENVAHAHATGLIPARPKRPRPVGPGLPKGEHHWTARHPQRVLRGEQLPGSKLTAEQVALIRTRAAGGARQCDLAAEYGVSRAQVCRIVNGARWREAA